MATLKKSGRYNGASGTPRTRMNAGTEDQYKGYDNSYEAAGGGDETKRLKITNRSLAMDSVISKSMAGTTYAKKKK